MSFIEKESYSIEEDMPDKPPTGALTVIVLLTFGIVFAVCGISFCLLWMLSERGNDEADTGMANATRLSYIAAEESFLKEGPFSIDDAINRVIERQSCDLKKLQ